MDISKRPGAFALQTFGGTIFRTDVQREELKLIMESIVIINAIHVTNLDQIAYIALSEQFEEIEVGEIIPSYHPMFEVDEKGKRIKCIWEKVYNPTLKTTENKGVN